VVHYSPTEPCDTGSIRWQHLDDASRHPSSHAQPLYVGPYTLYGVMCTPGTAAAVPRLPATYGCCCYGMRIRNLVGYPTDPVFESQSRQFYFSLFFGFGDSTPINRNSKLYAGIRRTYDRRQGEIQARKRYRQANARKGNHTFIVRLCVTSGRRHRQKANLPAVPIQAPAPLAGPRATVAKATERKNEIGGSEIKGVRENRKLW
jgi:hypothetical protein